LTKGNFSRLRSGETIPLFLWRLAWGGLFAVIAIGVLALVVLASGAADPPRAGPLIYQSTNATSIPLPNTPYTLEVTGRFSQTADPTSSWGIELTDPPLTPALFPQPAKNAVLAEGKGAIPVILDVSSIFDDNQFARNTLNTLPNTTNKYASFMVSQAPLSLRLRGGKGMGVAEGTAPLCFLLNGYGFFAIPPLQPDFTPFIHIRTHGESNKLTLNVGNDGQSVLRINDEIAWKGIIPPAHTAVIRHFAQFTLEQVTLYAPVSALPTIIPR